MTEPTHKLGSKTLEVVRFLKGQLSAAVATGAYWLVVSVLIFEQVYYVHAVVIGSAVGALTDFSIKKWWVFGTALQHSRAEMFRYALVSGASALWNGGIVYLLVDDLHFPKAPSVGIASVVVGVLWNYPMHRLFVFAHRSSPQEEA